MKTFKTYHYNSLYEFMDKAEQTPINKRLNSCEVSRKRTTFSQSKDITESINIVRNGQNLDLIDSKLDQIKTAEKNTIELNYDIAGMIPDVPEYLTGNPACMMNFSEIPESTNYIHLVLQIDESWKIEKDQFINKSIAISSIINDLEVNNYRVKLSLCLLLKFDKGIIGAIIDLKDYDQSLGLSEISGVLHPSFLRRIQFLWTEGRSWYNQYGDLDSSYGAVQKTEVIKKFLDDELNEKHLLLPSVTMLKIFMEDLYRRCDEMNTVEGAKVYANHMTDQIRGL